MDVNPLPELALSVRQPWAWAIIHGGKDIENRSAGSIRAGGMGPGRIAIHAALGMRQEEYLWAVWRLARDGVSLPRPDALIRGAIIGAVTVTGIVEASDSPWFGGPCGLVLADPVAVEPVAAKGALGYFKWVAGGEVARPAAWMMQYQGGDGGLFGELPPQFKEVPEKPWGRKKG
jgi:hypothetical protein